MFSSNVFKSSISTIKELSLRLTAILWLSVIVPSVTLNVIIAVVEEDNALAVQEISLPEILTLRSLLFETTVFVKLKESV